MNLQVDIQARPHIDEPLLALVLDFYILCIYVCTWFKSFTTDFNFL